MPASDANDFEMRLRHAKLEALAEFAAGAGHEINNPVATIIGHAQQLLAAEADPERRNALATIGAQAYRIRDMIGDVMLFARPPQPHAEPCDLAQEVQTVAERLRDDAARADIRLSIQADAPVPVSADRVQLAVVISNLIRNSMTAVGRSGRVEVAAYVLREGERRRAILQVQDDGPGLNAVEREHLFDPFFSGRQAGRGLGFGLAKCWRIVTLHGGDLTVDTPAQGGTRLTVELPLGESAAPPL